MALPLPAQLPAQPFAISLSIRHPSIDPAEISRTLDLAPLEAFRAGEPRRRGMGGPEARIHPETYWVAVFGPDAWLARPLFDFWPTEAARTLRRNLRFAGLGMLEMRLGMVCEHLRVRGGELLHRLRAEGARITLRVTLSPREVPSFTLPLAVGRALIELGITIELDFTAN